MAANCHLAAIGGLFRTVILFLQKVRAVGAASRRDFFFGPFPDVFAAGTRLLQVGAQVQQGAVGDVGPGVDDFLKSFE